MFHIENLGKNIQFYRKKKGITQKVLAAKCNLATGTIQQYELRKRTPSILRLKIVAEVLEVEVDELLK